MRISELSRHSGVPTSTIKFYIREKLIPPGTRSQRNQASYGEDHLRRLDLIRALREVADLPLDTVRAVLDQVDRPLGVGDPVGAAMQVIYPLPDRERSTAEQVDFERVRDQVEKLIQGLPWMLSGVDAPEAHYLNVDRLADAITQLRKHIDPEFPIDSLAGFAEAAWLVSEVAFASQEDRVPRPGDDLIDPTRTAILGTLLLEPLITNLVRTALVMRSTHISTNTPLPNNSRRGRS